MTPLYIRMVDAPGVFSVSDDTLRRWAKDGKIRIYKPGTMTMLKVSEVCAHIDSSAAQMGD